MILESGWKSLAQELYHINFVPVEHEQSSNLRVGMLDPPINSKN